MCTVLWMVERELELHATIVNVVEEWRMQVGIGQPWIVKESQELCLAVLV